MNVQEIIDRLEMLHTEFEPYEEAMYDAYMENPEEELVFDRQTTMEMEAIQFKIETLEELLSLSSLKHPAFEMNYGEPCECVGPY